MSLELLGARLGCRSSLGENEGSWSTIPSVNTPSITEAPTLDAVRAGRETLRRNMRGSAVSFVQRALRLYGVTDDGVFGSDTEAAVRRFQEDYGLVPADGIVGKKTLATIDNPPALKPDAKPVAEKPSSLFTSSPAPAPLPQGGGTLPAPVAPKAPTSSIAVPLLAGGAGLAFIGLLVAIFTGRKG